MEKAILRTTLRGLLGSLVAAVICWSGPANAAGGFNDDFEAFSGDYNSDGRLDLFIRERPRIVLLHGDVITPITLPTAVQSFVLVQNDSQSFDLEPVPALGLAGWSEAPVELTAVDVNLDGELDLLVQGIDSVPGMGAGVLDQIVYSPSPSVALSIRAIDDEFREFFDQLGEWLQSPAYFDENAIPVYGPQTVTEYLYVPEYCGTASVAYMAIQPPVPTRVLSSEPNLAVETAYLLNNCALMWGNDFNVHYDFVAYQWTETVQIGLDYSGLNQDALAFSALLPQIANGLLGPLGPDAIEVEDILSRVLGSVIMERVLSQGGVLDIELGLPDILIESSRQDRILEVLRKILVKVILREETSNEDPEEEEEPLRLDCPVDLLCSDVREVRIAPNQAPPYGTYFFPGAGFDGGYINDFVLAFTEAGIARVNSTTDSMSFGTAIDALSSVFTMTGDIGGVVSAQSNADATTQFNLIGYSYGSLVAAQTAAAYARSQVFVDNLVLIGSPISLEFLGQLQANPFVRNVIVVNLTQHGDPIVPGISKAALLAETFTLAMQQQNGTGHFYYAPQTAEGAARRRALAADLFAQGLR